MREVYVFFRKNMKANLWKAVLFSVLCITTFSCSNELHMLFPEGPEGPAGKSAYEVWVDEVNGGNIDWPKDRTDVNNFFLYLKGEDGKDGQSAYEIWIEEVEKGLENPHNPGTDWPKDETELNDFWYYLSGADGKDGVTPNIGDNGNWWVNGEDTGISAQGPKGEDGEDGEDGKDGADGDDGSMPDIKIINGNWYINGVDTGVSAKGDKGDDGTSGSNGKSAYELWVEAVKSDEGLKDPHNPGYNCDPEKTTIEDFWAYLRSEDGKDGEDGDDGKPGEGEQTAPEKGKYNVIAYRSNLDNEEYVNWPDGSLTFKVYDKEQKPAPEGTKVKIKELKDAEDQEFEVGKDGLVTIPKKYLPDTDVTTSAYVKTNDMTDYEETPKNTLVSARIDTKIVLQESNDLKVTFPLQLSLMDDNGTKIPCLNIYFKVLRKVGSEGEWEAIPEYVGATTRDIYLFTYQDGSSSIGEDVEGEEIPVPNNTNIDIAKTNTCMVQVQRKVIATGTNKIDVDKIPADDKWENGTKESIKYITIGVVNCYGDNPKLQAKIEMRPAQYAPLLKTLTQTGEVITSSGGTSKNVSLKGTFDTNMVEKSLCFSQDYQKQEGSTRAEEIDVYVPVKMEDSDFGTKELLQLSFTKDLDNITAKAVSMKDEEGDNAAEFKADNVWVPSMLSIKVLFQEGKLSQSINFYPLSQFGVITDDNNDGTVNYRTYKTDTHPVCSDYELTVSKEDKEDQENK